MSCRIKMDLGVWLQVGALADFWAECSYGVCDFCSLVASLGDTKTPKELSASVKAGVGHLLIIYCKVGPVLLTRPMKCWIRKQGLLFFCNFHPMESCASRSRMIRL